MEIFDIYLRGRCFYMLFEASWLWRVESDVGRRRGRPVDVGVDAGGFVMGLRPTEELLSLLKATKGSEPLSEA